MLCRNGTKLNLDPEAKLSQKDLCTAIGGRLQLVRETSLGNFPQKKKKSGDSLVVTDPTTNPPVSGLTMGERTGSRIFHYLWSYVLGNPFVLKYIRKLW
jgi:hypothetical protein